MPEGPEIRRTSDRLAAVLEGQRIEGAFFEQRHLAAADIVGTYIEHVTPRGKAILTQLSNGLALYTHNQLYGVWRVERRGKLAKTRRTLRVALHTQTHSALLYSASDIALLDPAALAVHPYLAKLGPDALDPETEWRDIAARLTDSTFRRRSLGALLLDQSFVAGIGNYLRSEILHVVSQHPARRPVDMTRREVGALARTTLELTRRSYATGGTTNAPGRVSKMRKAGQTRAEYRFAVFGRAGLACYCCGSNIKRIEVGARRLYLCEHCQPRDGRQQA